jgi:hypothetical protein
MGNFTRKHRWGIFMTFVLTVLSQFVHAQSGSTGSTFVHTGGEMGIFGQHNFQNGSGTISAGIIGSERQPAIGVYSFVSPTGSWVGASNQAFVDGYVRTYNSGPFTFPIGDNGKYRPAAVSASSDTASTTAAYYGVDPGTAITSDLKGGNYGILPGGGPAFSTASKDANIGSVDNVEYWDIDGVTPTRITLTWDANTPVNAMVGTNLSYLTIVGWDGTQWVAIPSTIDVNSLIQTTSTSAFTGPGATVSAGSITTNFDVEPGSFTVYTLAGMVCDLEATVAGVPITNCNNVNDGALEIDYSGSATYQYSVNGGAFQLLTESPFLVTGLAAGSYTVVVQSTTDPSCMSVLTGEIVNPTAPVVSTVVVSNPTDCTANNGALAVVLANNSDGVFEYSIDNGGSWQPDSTFSGLSAGNYTVLVRNAIAPTCQVNAGTFTIQVPGSVTATITGDNQDVCEVNKGTITISAGGGTSVYEFSLNGGLTWTNLSSNPFLIQNLAPANYSVVVRDKNITSCLAQKQVLLGTEICPVPILAPFKLD